MVAGEIDPRARHECGEAGDVNSKSIAMVVKDGTFYHPAEILVGDRLAAAPCQARERSMAPARQSKIG